MVAAPITPVFTEPYVERHASPEYNPRGSGLQRIVAAVPPTCVTLALSFIGIRERGMWNDEYATWHASSLSFGGLLRLLDHIDAVIAPYYFFMHIWIAIFGDSATALRIPSAIAMATAAGATALIGRTLFGTGVGLGAGLLFAAIPSVSRYGQEARPYALAIAATTIATLLLLHSLRRPRWRNWFFYAAALIAAGFFHVVSFTVVAAHFLFFLLAFRGSKDFRLLRWFAAFAISITALLPMATKGAGQDSAIDWIKADSRAVQQFPLKLFGSWPVVALITGAALVAILLLWRTSRGAVVLLATWAVLPPVFCYATFPILGLFLHRYLLFTLPAWAILGVASIVSITGNIRPRLAASVAATAGALLLACGAFYLGLPGQHSVRAYPNSGEPDFRAAAEIVSSRMLAGDGVAFSGVLRNGRRPFNYEFRDHARPYDVFLAKSSEQLGTFGSVECAQPGLCAAAYRRIWLVTSNPAPTDPFAGMPRTISDLLKGEFTRTEVQRATNVRVYLLTRNESQ